MRWAFTTTDVSPSRATHGKSRRGMAPLGKAWHGLDSSGRGAFTGATPRRCLPLLGAWHGMARSGWDRHGVVWHGSPRYGTTSWCAAGFDSLPLSPPLWGQGQLWRGMARRCGLAAGRCKAGRAREQHGGLGLSLLLSQGAVLARRCGAWCDMARRGNSPLVGMGRFLPTVWLLGSSWFGLARHGSVRWSKARQGTPLRRGHNT